MSRTRLTTSSSAIKYTSFSERQKYVLTWWRKGSALRNYNGIICDGAIRSGKTMCLSLSFVMWAMENFNGMNFAICGKTIGALRRNVINDLKKMVLSRGYRVEDRRSVNMLVISHQGHSNVFYMFGGTNEGSQDLIQGITLAGIFLDEVALMPESFVNQATGRCSVEGAKMWFSCNPAGSRLHWFKQNWINQFQAKKLLYLHFTMDDNTSLSDNKKQMYQQMYAGVFYRRYIEGRWVNAEGVIFDMWSDRNLCDESEVPWGNRYVGIDYGTTNPMVFLEMIDDGKTYWIKQEYYFDSRKEQRQKTDFEYANDFEEFVDRDKSITVVIDPSALSFKTELRNRGYHVRDAKNDVMDGIRVTATLIQRQKVRAVRNKCLNLEHELQSYVWDEKAAMHGEERPVKENDHACDALRYLCNTVTSRWRRSE